MSVDHLVLQEAAIDLGFFSTKFTSGTGSDRSGTVIHTDMFPSWAIRSSDSDAISKGKQLGSVQHDGVTVQVEGVSYFVGKSSLRATSGVSGQRIAHANYSQSPEYKALLLGALYYIAQRQNVRGSLTIDMLCMGLPVTTFFSHREELEKLAQGTHLVPCPSDHTKTIKIHVKETLVVSQPQGAALNFGMKLGTRLENERIVVLDMGGGTFDWFFMDRLHPNFSRSGAAQLGVLSCVNAICDKIDPKYKNAPGCIERINDALIENSTTLRIDGHEFAMDSLWPAAEHVLDSAIREMAKSVGNFSEVDRFLFTGGGATLLEKAARAKKSALVEEQRKFVVEKNPVYANVLGFHSMAQLALEDAS